MDYRELINEAENILDEETKKQRKEKRARKRQSQKDATKRKKDNAAKSEKPSKDAKAANKTKAVKKMKKPKVVSTPPKIEKGTKEDAEEYAIDNNQPLENLVKMLGSIYNKGTMPAETNSDAFIKTQKKLLDSKESGNERYLKLQATKHFDLYYEDGLGNNQGKLASFQTEMDAYILKYVGTPFIIGVKGTIKDTTQQTNFGKMYGHLLTHFVTSQDFVNTDSTNMNKKFPKASDDFAGWKEVQISTMANKIYMIYIAYRFVTLIKKPTLLKNPEQANRFARYNQMKNKDIKMATGGGQFGTETNVENILLQALKQSLQIKTADIKLVEGFLDTLDLANRFIVEDKYSSLGNIDPNQSADIANKVVDTGLAAGAAVKQVGKEIKNDNSLRTLNIMKSIPKRLLNQVNKNKAEINQFPEVLSKYIVLLSMVFNRGAFSPEKFNTLVTAKELNKVDQMQNWLEKNDAISKSNNYLQNSLDFMVWSKMNGPGGDPSWAERYSKRWPKFAKSLKLVGGAVKLGGKGLKALAKIS